MGILSDLGKKELIFTFGRYIVYFFQIIKGFLLAKILGPEFFGLFGIFILIQQYLVYSNLGVQYALNIKLSVNNEDQSSFSEKIKSIINSSFVLFVFTSISLIIISIIIIYYKFDFNYEIPTSYFIFGLLGITLLFHLQEIFLNIFRIQKKFYIILATEILVSLSAIIVIPFFNGLELLYAVIISWFFALLISISIFKINYEYRLKWDTKMIKPLLLIGVPFLIYNFSFNLISMTSRSFVAYFYDIKEMGFFTFAVSLTTAIMLIFNSASWIIYPRLISKLSDKNLNTNDQQLLLFDLTKKTIAVLFILVMGAILFLPVIFFILPEYSVSFNTIIILLINQIIVNSGFAVSSYLVGRDLFKLLISSSLIALIFCVFLSFLFTNLNFDYSWIAFANLIASIVFINYVIFITCKKQKLDYKYLINSFNFFVQISLISFALFTLFDLFKIGLIIFFLQMIIFLKNDILDFFKVIKTKISE